MNTRLLIRSGLGGVFFLGIVQWLGAQSAIQQLGGQPLQNQFDQLKSTGQQGGGAASGGGTTSAGGGISFTPAQQQAMMQVGGTVGNMLGNMLAQPANLPTVNSFQQQQQIAAQQLNNSGVYLLKKGSYASAINEFQQALARNPGDKTIQSNLKLARQKLAQAQAGDANAAQTSSDLGKLLGLPPTPGPGTDTENSSYTTVGPAGSPQVPPGGALLNLDGGASTLDSAAGAQPAPTAAISALTPTPASAAPDTSQVSSQADTILGVAPSGPAAENNSTAPTADANPPAAQNSAPDPTSTTAAATSSDAADGSTTAGTDQKLSAGTALFGQPVSHPTMGDLNADSAAAGSGFDTSGKILGSGGGGMDSGVVDLRGKQGIVDPAVLKQNSSASITPAADANYWNEVRQDLDQNGRDAPADIKKSTRLPPLIAGQPIPEAWLSRFKNKALRNWIANNVKCKEAPWFNGFGISGGSELMITASYINDPAKSTDDEKLNLMAFELGKVFWSQSITGFGEPPATITSFLVDNQPVIKQMVQDISEADGGYFSNLGDFQGPEGSSQFGAVFRAVLLNVPSKSTSQSQVNSWNNTSTQFVNTFFQSTANPTKKPGIVVPSPVITTP